MSQVESDDKFPNAIPIVQAVFSRMKKSPHDYQFMLDVIENEILGEDTIGRMYDIFKKVRYVDSSNVMYTFTGDEMVYFLENYMIPTDDNIDKYTKLTWPLNHFFREPTDENYKIFIYTDDEIIMYEGIPARHEFLVIPRS
jgi:hypothetical protein